MKRTFRKAYEAGNSTDVEKNTGISETVPDQSLSVRQILKRYASGIAPEVMTNQNYSEDMPDLRGLDMSELHEMRIKAANDYIEAHNQVNNPSPTPSPTVVEPLKEEQ